MVKDGLPEDGTSEGKNWEACKSVGLQREVPNGGYSNLRVQRVECTQLAHRT